jgi:sugar-phosphatase
MELAELLSDEVREFLTRAFWLVDFDGTLGDSLAAQGRAFGKWAELRGVDAGPFVELLGVTARRKLELFAPHLDIEAELAVIERLEIEESYDVTALPGARALFMLPLRFGIVTSGSRNLFEARMRAAKFALDRPEVIITATEVRQSKPDPAGFLEAAARVGIAPERCAGFEDSLAGMAALFAAGCLPVGVTTVCTTAQLEAEGAAITVPDLGAFIRALTL